MEHLSIAVDFLLTHKLLLTALILLGVISVRRLVLEHIRGDAALITEKQRKWMSRTKNGVFTVTLLALFMLWQSEISEFALGDGDCSSDCGGLKRDHFVFHRIDSAREFSFISDRGLD